MNKAKQKAVEYAKVEFNSPRILFTTEEKIDLTMEVWIRAIDIAILETKKETIKKINNSYDGNELCPVCKIWFDAWIEDLKGIINETKK